MSSTRRLWIVIAALDVAFLFLFAIILLYFLTPKEDQAIPVGSREKIREYSRQMTYLIISDLKQKTEAKDTTSLSGQKTYKVAVDSAKKAYSLSKKPMPKNWDAIAILSAFSSERSMFDAIESVYRERVLSLKNVHSSALQLGLDLAGGMSAVIQADLKGLSEKVGHTLTAAEKEDAMKRAVEILNSRIDKFGLTEPVIRRQGEDQIYIEIPGTPDPERISSIIMGKGNLAFYIVDSEASASVNSYLSTNPLGIDEQTMTVAQAGLVPAGEIVRKVYKKDSYGLDEFTGEYLVLQGTPGLDGSHIQSASVSTDPITGKPETNFVLDKAGGDLFYKLTSDNVGKTMAVVLDDRVKSYARIQEPIRESVRITGFSADEAESLALLLRTAALPISLSVVSQQAVGASMGEDAIGQGQRAILVGILSIFIFMFGYYKWAGLNATIAQVINLYLMLSILTAFKLTLTLPSIAGFVLTTGMAVDANVIIFERIKEELRAGKTRAAAIHAGFDKAFWAVMDSNITTIIAALFLAQLGTGPIQGFAVSLAIGNITSLFTALFVSHLIFDFETDVLKATHTSISWRVQ
jgi:preprotein translocase subunit SecD